VWDWYARNGKEVEQKRGRKRMTATGIIGTISMLVVAGVIINDFIKNK